MSFPFLPQWANPKLRVPTWPLVLSGAFLGVLAPSASAQTSISYNGGVYTQGFDGTVFNNGVASSDTPLSNTAGAQSSVLPAGFGVSGNNYAVASYSSSGFNGLNAPNPYSLFTTSNPSNRAFGSFAPGGSTYAYGFVFQNNTNHAITNFTISYTGEVWGTGGYGSFGSPRRDLLDFQYKVGANSINESGFQEVNSNQDAPTATPGPGDFTVPTSVTSSGSKDGTAPENQQTVTQSFSVNIPAGSTIAVRFLDYSAANGYADLLAIDNFSFSEGTIGSPIAGAISYTGGTYTQGFDGTAVNNGVTSTDTALANSGFSGTSVPTGFKFAKTGGSPSSATTYQVGTGNNVPNVYSLFPQSTPANRAFGSLIDGRAAPNDFPSEAMYGFLLQNNTGHPLSSFTVSYTGEVWGVFGQNGRDLLDLQYKVGASSIAESGFQEVNSNAGQSTPTPGPGDFVTPAGLPLGSRDGSLPGNQQTITQTFTVNIPAGSTIVVRFVDSGAAVGVVDRLAIDNFSFSATVARPEALISEYFMGQPQDTGIGYVELYNNSGAPLDLNGYSLVSGTTKPGTTIYTFTASTIVPERGHVLLTGPRYGAYGVQTTDLVPNGNGGLTPATNGTLSADMVYGGGLALLRPPSIATNTVVDQVGAAGYFEGTAVTTYNTVPVFYVRRVPIDGSVAYPVDTDNNASDFVPVSPFSTSAVVSATTPRLGLSGPEGLLSPIQNNGYISSSDVKKVRNATTGAGGFNLGTQMYRRRLVNTGPNPITVLRVRAVDITAGTGPAGAANTLLIPGDGSTSPENSGLELPINSAGFFPLFVQSSYGPGGYNASLVMRPDVPFRLEPGQSVDVEFGLGINSGGTCKFYFSYETK